MAVSSRMGRNSPDITYTRPRDKSDVMIRSNLEEITSRFGVLLSDVKAALKANHVRTSDVHSVIIEMYPQCNDVIPKTNLDSLFRAASRCRIWSYEHHSPVEKLLRRFIPDRSCIIKEYKEHLAGFYTTTKLIDYIRFFNNAISISSGRNELDIGSFTSDHYKTLTVKLDVDRIITTRSLQYVQDLWKQFAEEFNIPFLTAVLDSILEGSLIIIWLVPTQVADKIAGSVHKATPFFKRQNIVSVAIDDNVIYRDGEGSEMVRNTRAIRDHLKPLLESRMYQCYAAKKGRQDILISEEVLDNIITKVIRIENASERFYTVSVHIGDVIKVDSLGKFTHVHPGGGAAALGGVGTLDDEFNGSAPDRTGVYVLAIGGAIAGALIGGTIGLIGGGIGAVIGGTLGANYNAIAGAIGVVPPGSIGGLVARLFGKDIVIPLAEVLRSLGTATETEDRLYVTIRMDNAP